jgi:hypothetical protein
VVEKSRLAEVAKNAVAQRRLERAREKQLRGGASLIKLFHLEAMDG